MQRKFIPVFLAAALLISVLLSTMSIHGLQGNARIINYAGVVRGATQRLVKQELNGKSDDALISRLDGILLELTTGDGENQLGRLNDETFLSLMSEMQEEWDEIKTEIYKVRQGKPGTDLYVLSEEYFELADRTVSAAEDYTEKQVQRAEIGIFSLNSVFLLLAALFGWYGTVQDRRQKRLAEAEKANRLRGERLEQMSINLRAPLDEISELMYIADLETYELLFVNEAGRKTFGITDLSSKKCYQAIQGREKPCDFCTKQLLVSGENHTWEYTNPLTKKHYLLKSRLIQWDGRPARLEMAFDMTEAEEEKQALKNTLDAEQIVMECVRMLYQEHDLNISTPIVLEHLVKFLEADRAYLGSVRDGLMYNDYEWCREGITSQKDMLQEIPLSAVASWLPIFKHQECVILEDISVLKDSYPEEYELLHSQDIHSLVAAPLEQDGQLHGLVGVDNPPISRIRSIASLLQTLCYFLMLARRRSESEQQLSHMSYFDTLTSFYNRNRYIEDSEILSRKEGAIGVVYLDVNGLKDINDQFGHACGDKILTDCARQMKEVFQKADFYRIGGDEFVILCHSISKPDFENQVSKLRQSFGKEGFCHMAIGAQWAESIHNIQQMIAAADAQMYEDKKEFYRKNPASNRYRHHSDEVLSLSSPDVLEEELRQKHFVIFLQPKIDSSDRSAIGAEALIRYKSRSGSLLLPGNFLPLLEESQTVSQIDFYVFEFACSQLCEWEKQGKRALPVSVNFSKATLSQPDFVSRLCALCLQYGVEKKYLEIELTGISRNPDFDIKSLIHDLRQEGFSVSIDSLGSEEDKFALLSQVEIDVLKLDKDFVGDLTCNKKTQAVMEDVFKTCKQMQIQVVAEGVETEEQLAALRKCGVELVQGFLFSKPIPIEEYEKEYL